MKKAQPSSRWLGVLGCKSLTMTYFHTGTRTIIGADAFHCPVRDGKEWYHVAMVIRHKGLSARSFDRADEFIEFGISFWRIVLNASTWHNTLI